MGHIRADRTHGVPYLFSVSSYVVVRRGDAEIPFREFVKCWAVCLPTECTEFLILKLNHQNSSCSLLRSVNVSVPFISVPANAPSKKTLLIRTYLDFLVDFLLEADGELWTASGLGELTPRNSAIAVSRSDRLIAVCGMVLCPCSVVHGLLVHFAKSCQRFCFQLE